MTLQPSTTMRVYNTSRGVLASVAHRLGFLAAKAAVLGHYGPRIRFERIASGRGDEAEARWSRRLSETRLTIVVVTYQQPLELDCMLKSLLCQTLQNFEVLVMHDGHHDETAALMRTYTDAHPSRFRYYESPTRYNDYGHTLRHEGIGMAETEYLLITNGDNYYMPRAIEFIFDALDRDKLDMVMWDVVHSHRDPGGVVQESYRAFSTLPIPKRLDMGCFVVRTERAKKAGFRERGFAADAFYFDDLLKAEKTTRIGKLEKILMVHN